MTEYINTQRIVSIKNINSTASLSSIRTKNLEKFEPKMYEKAASVYALQNREVPDKLFFNKGL